MNMAVVPDSTQKILLVVSFCVVKTHQFMFIITAFNFDFLVPLVFLVAFSFGER